MRVFGGTLADRVLLGSSRMAPAFYASVNFPGGEIYRGTDGNDNLGTNFFMPEAVTAEFPFLAARISGPIRLPISWEAAQPTIGGALDTSYLTALTNGLNALQAAGLTAVIDLHNYMERFVSGTKRSVDNADGVLTRAHLVDFWQRLVTALKAHPAIAGWDLMNEPQGGHGPLGVIMQAVVNAVAAIDPDHKIYIEGAGYSSAKEWVTRNSSYYPLAEPIAGKKLLIYSGHCYPDYDHSGTHFGYNENANASSGDPLTPTTLVDLSTAFVNWCKTNKVQGHIGETNVGIDDPRWNTVLLNGLAYWRAADIPVSLWLYGPRSSNDPYNLFPTGGVIAPQWSVIQQVIGKGPNILAFTGPQNASAGVATSLSVGYPGYVASPLSVTLSDSGAGGTFSPASITFAAGASQPSQTVTYTQPGTKAVTLSAAAAGYTAPSIGLTTDPANPISAAPMASRKFSDWSSNNAGIAVNSTFATDSTGGKTSARVSDNGANAQHFINSPVFTILAGGVFESEWVVMMESIRYLRLYAKGEATASTVGVEIDLQATQIMSGINTGTAVLLDATIASVANGFKRVRIKGQLGAKDAKARHFAMLENASRLRTYTGNGAPIYLDIVNAFVGPVHTIVGAPISLVAPTLAFVSGSGAVGSVLGGTDGTWTGSPTSYAYAWYRNGTAISGATGSTYTTVAADAGTTVTRSVAATNAAGTSVVVTVSPGVAIT